MGEGAGVVVLEEYERAKARGAQIYAEVDRLWPFGDAYHVTAPHPEGSGAYRSMQMAIRKSGLSLSDIDYINCPWHFDTAWRRAGAGRGAPAVRQ